MTVINSKRRVTHLGALTSETLRDTVLANVPDAPDDAVVEMWVHVPSGGDYSGVRLRLDEGQDTDVQFSVEWEEK